MREGLVLCLNNSSNPIHLPVKPQCLSRIQLRPIGEDLDCVSSSQPQLCPALEIIATWAETGKQGHFDHVLPASQIVYQKKNFFQQPKNMLISSQQKQLFKRHLYFLQFYFLIVIVKVARQEIILLLIYDESFI